MNFQVVGDITKDSTLAPEYFKGVKKVINAVSVIVGPKEGDTPDRAKYSQVRFCKLITRYLSLGWIRVKYGSCYINFTYILFQRWFLLILVFSVCKSEYVSCIVFFP